MNKEILIAATFVIIIWGINQAQSVVVLSLVSVFLAAIGTMPALWCMSSDLFWTEMVLSEETV